MASYSSRWDGTLILCEPAGGFLSPATCSLERTTQSETLNLDPVARTRAEILLDRKKWPHLDFLRRANPNNNTFCEECTMSLRIQDVAPDFVAETTQGTIKFHEWIGDGWAVLFSHPKDFTPVCTTELGYMAGLQPEFARRNCKIIGLSVDSVESHNKWEVDIEETQGHKVTYPMIGDPELKVAKLYDMLPAEAGETCEGRTAVNNQTVRTVFVIGPDKKIKLMLTYPMSTGRNFNEVLRALDSIQLTAQKQVATPVNWNKGDDVIILPSVSNDEAKKKYPGGWKEPRPYLRIVPQPK
jgi:alkyl hydroperoxide reductase subunit AhpC